MPVWTVTRSHKHNDRDHVGLADGTAEPEAHLPRYFAKSGFAGTDPKKTKKEGGGKGNWGRDGDEVQDFTYNMTNPRRRSNSSSTGPGGALKTKFETVEAEPVFEEELHGPVTVGSEDSTAELEHSITESSSDSSVQEEEAGSKKM
ncbi:hypothetical protein H2201_006983 [Coniosporium apollinis]|uniref:Hyaluronan/mRNA-binding protein domain-containing protein n=2 Tax=Coniosporium TaxID=2810619 RepID=A0ABQ9NKG4_9PEZI|nr:hypothetical protein H2199_004856 [Cladosporium sp. JES 115]KAJ9660237.1 hypothetical protein H2201_006983 [Coniosporium apollinis]